MMLASVSASRKFPLPGAPASRAKRSAALDAQEEMLARHCYDAARGSNYNYFRDYDPSIGRYVESDPIGLYGGANTFGYVSGSPLNKTDRDGLQAALVAPALVSCGPVCWTTVAIVGGAALILSQCTNDNDKTPPVPPDRKQRCQEAFKRCLADTGVPESKCFDAYNECIKHNETFIFPGRGNRNNPVK